jgi:hypothetical protein
VLSDPLAGGFDCFFQNGSRSDAKPRSFDPNLFRAYQVIAKFARTGVKLVI